MPYSIELVLVQLVWNNLPGTLYVSGGVVVEPGPDEIGNPVLSVTGIVNCY
jgi:hypothetical protein